MKTTVTTSEILNSEMSNIRMTSSPKKGQHYSLQFRLGVAIPTDKSQLKKFTNLDCLCKKDVELIDSIMKSQAMEPKFVFTKSKGFCRLENFSDFKKALEMSL